MKSLRRSRIAILHRWACASAYTVLRTRLGSRSPLLPTKHPPPPAPLRWTVYVRLSLSAGIVRGRAVGLGLSGVWDLLDALFEGLQLLPKFVALPLHFLQ